MRIVSLAPSNTEIVCELGVRDDLVGTTSLCDHPPGVESTESLGGWSEGVDLEKVKELDPDIILTSDKLQREVVSKLKNKPYDVLHVEPERLIDVYMSIERIGTALGREKRAKNIVEEMKSKISEMDLGEARIYCEEWMDPPMISGNWVPDLIKKANGLYMIKGGLRSHKTDIDNLIEFDPDFIFLNVCGAGSKAEKSVLKDRESFSNISAVEENNVFVLDDALLNRPGPRLVEGIKQISDHVS